MGRVEAELEIVKDKLNDLQRTVKELNQTSISSKVWDVMMKLAVPVALAAAAAVLGNREMLTKHDANIEEIQQNRFTNRDAYELERRLAVEAKAFVTESEKRIMTALAQMPPAWLTDIVSSLKTGQDEIVQRLTVVETTLRNNKDH